MISCPSQIKVGIYFLFILIKIFINSLICEYSIKKIAQIRFFFKFYLQKCNPKTLFPPYPNSAGVLPLEHLGCTGTPNSSKIFDDSTFPAYAASCKGDHPVLGTRQVNSAPHLFRRRRHSTNPKRAAKWTGAHPSQSRRRRSLPLLVQVYFHKLKFGSFLKNI